MTKQEVVRTVLDGGRPPYVPWSFGFTLEARKKLSDHYGTDDVGEAVGDHFVLLGNDYGFFKDVGDDCVRDVFGVTWDRSVDKDIGIVKGCVLPEPTLDGYSLPDPLDSRFFEDIPFLLQRYADRFRVFQIGFSLFERAWTLRGMENLLLDMHENPEFVHTLLGVIADYNIAQLRKAAEYDIDAVYFGDDWGQQHGLIMGPGKWREFILPVLRRMYGAVRETGKYVFIHSCGDVDELFDDLIEIGLDCFNPFQPEVMNVGELLQAYRGQLAFHGGLSTQRTLPYGTVEEVRAETRRLLSLGSQGGLILAPAHSVEGDVSLENMLAFIDEAKAQN